MKVVPIEETVTLEAQLRHITKLLEEQREITRYDMDGRTYLRVRLPECDCNGSKVSVTKKKPRRKPIGGSLAIATEIVTDMLADGPRLSTDIIEAGQAEGLSKRTMLRAKQALAATSKKVGKVWLWELN
jgi:hypothetical protein